MLTLQLSLAPAHAAGPPEIATTWVTGVTSTSAVLHTEINPKGSSTHYQFEYLTAAEYEANQAAGHDPFAGARAVPTTNNGLGSGNVFQTVSFTLSPPLNSLSPDTEYRYRAFASSSGGSTPGPTRSLRTQASAPPSGLPDQRAWELVSPLDKAGGAIAAPGSLFGGAQIQAAAAGGALTYSAPTAFAGALGAPPASQYLSRRSPAGWSSENVSFPLRSGAYGDQPDGVPFRLFAPQLDSGLRFGGYPCRGSSSCSEPDPPLQGSGAPAGFSTFYRRSSDGTYISLLTAADLAHSTVSPANFSVSLAASTPDLSSAYLSTCAALTANAVELMAEPGRCQPAMQNLYRSSAAGLEAVNILPNQTQTIPGARIAAPIGAVSDSGSAAYFTLGEDGPLYLFEAGAATRLVQQTEGAAVSFQAASGDAGIAYFLRGSTLYRYDRSTQSSAPLAGAVTGVLAASADGDSVYFQSATGLRLWHQGTITQVAPGPNAAAPSDFPPATGTARLSSDGTRLAFLSEAEIGDQDNHDAETGEATTQLYLYDSTNDRLVCVSCNPTGERPLGGASIPGALHNGATTAYKPRVLSADGGRIFFDSFAPLTSRDTDASPDVYQWEAGGEGSCSLTPGCLGLISGGRQQGGTFLDASADGSDVFFLTGDSLVHSDPGSIDVYDARVAGGLPEPEEPFVCTGDACQPLPSPPEDPTAGTSLPNSGNAPTKYYKEHQKRHHHRHKKHRHHQRSHR